MGVTAEESTPARTARHLRWAGMISVKLRCRCGSIQGSVDFSRRSRVRVVCHCGDCQTYARHLGNPLAIQIVQATPDQVRFHLGKEHLRCLRLTEGGLTRWYAACCRTPLANTSRHAWVPFVGVMNCSIDAEDESLLGPAVLVNGPHPVPWRTVLRFLRVLLLGVLLRRHRPSPFFDERGKPVAQPDVIA